MSISVIFLPDPTSPTVTLMCDQDTFGSHMNGLGTREGQEDDADSDDDDDDDERGEDPRIEVCPARDAAAARIATEREGGYPSPFPPPTHPPTPTPTPTPTDTVLTIPTPTLKPSPSMSRSSPAADRSMG